MELMASVHRRPVTLTLTPSKTRFLIKAPPTKEGSVQGSSLSSKPWKLFTSLKCRAEDDIGERKQTYAKDVVALRAYQTFSAMFSLAVPVFMFATSIALTNFMGLTYTPWRDLVLRYAGGLFIVPISMAKCMEKAIDSDRLDTPLYQRIAFTLAVGVTIMCTTRLVGRRAGFSNVYFVPMMLLQILPAIAFLKLYGLRPLAGVVPDALSAVRSLFRYRNVTSLCFSLLTLVIFGCACISICCPQAILGFMWNAPCDQFAKFIIRLEGGSVLMLSAMCFTFKEASDEGLLSSTTFKHLGLAALVEAVSMIGSTLYIAWPFTQGVTDCSAQLLTRNGWITTIGVFSMLAYVSSMTIRTKRV